MVSTGKRYSLSIPESMVPCVEIHERPIEIGSRIITGPRLKRCYGFTLGHAWKRAVTWSRKHGDPRW